MSIAVVELQPEAHSLPLGWRIAVLLLATVITAALTGGDTISMLAIPLLLVGWMVLWKPGSAPVLALAFSYQWFQVTCAPLYRAFAMRQIRDLRMIGDALPIELIGMGWLVALLIGLWLGSRTLANETTVERASSSVFEVNRKLFFYYVGATAVASGFREFAWEIPALTQPLLALLYVRLAVVYLICRQLVRPPAHWGWLALLLCAEILIGFTGYFATFREALVVVVLALLERFDFRRLSHWLSVSIVLFAAVICALLWLNVRNAYRHAWQDDSFAGASRSAHLEKLGDITEEWFSSENESGWRNIDMLIARFWSCYYPAIVLDRVPSILPHENGRLLAEAVEHVLTPRLLNPNKASLESESVMVRRYTGEMVAGPEHNTSIAFGYMPESYIDFGVPLMFIPIFLFGFGVAVLLRGLRRNIQSEDIREGAYCIIGWVSLYLFERSWAKTLGVTITCAIMIGGGGLLLDRLILRRAKRRGEHPIGAQA